MLSTKKHFLKSNLSAERAEPVPEDLVELDPLPGQSRRGPFPGEPVTGKARSGL